ncbi:MAG: Nickel transport complex, NikM subunit, transmembrane [Synergistales bacterium 54_24]|nr:MAG: Nickel transport complex, NikM subunit, transmembrane [Synergistales bacterium 54_24]MBC7076961.1 DUF4198 domain-containing protein [Synergistales bacterium]HAF51129.1 DUF4198 domain-containing protein [Synergistaceae bacterium]
MVKSKLFIFFIVAVLPMVMATAAFAHFQAILPSDNILTQDEDHNVTLSLLFIHPFEQQLMDMERPAAFGVMARGQKTNLLPTLSEFSPAEGFKAWKTSYEIRRPGDHIFYVEPTPYWEPAEGKYIIHYAKSVVNAFGMEEGWDAPVDLRAEILPLTRPYGLWKGNVFQGQVLVEGVPLSGAFVEIEYYNEGLKRRAPAPPFVTQVVRADERGVFTYGLPWEGWWGFAALADAPETMKSPSGEDAPVELGAVMWVRAKKDE